MSLKNQEKPARSGGAKAAAVAHLPAGLPGLATASFEVELPEPVAEPGTVPVWLIALLALLVFMGDMYLTYYGADIGGKAGSFPALVYYPPFQSYAQVDAANPKSAADLLAAQGWQAFNANCAPCHQPSGLGNPSQNIPPLAGSEWVLAPGPGRAIRIVLNSLKGPVSVKGQTFENPAMPPWRSALSDEQIAALLTYVRGNKDWGHSAPPVTPDQVKKIRDATASRADQWTAAELQQVPDTE
jgi:mono/diheme cytochrome c family protein